MVESLFLIGLMRVVHATLNSMLQPLFDMIVADYYTKETRGTPNAIVASGNFIGIALSSISIIII